MKAIINIILLSIFFAFSAKGQRSGSSALILGNASPLEGSTETYYIQSRGEPVPPGTVFQWVIANGVKIAENTNPATANLSVTVTWNFGVTSGRVTLVDVSTQAQIYKDIQIIPYYQAAPFCNEIAPLHQEMTWSLTGQALYAPRNTCAIQPGNPYQIIYKWQSALVSPDDDLLPNPVLNWQDVPSATSESILPLPMNDYGSLYYRRIMYISDGSGGTLLAAITSNPVRCRLSGLSGGQIFDVHNQTDANAVIQLAYNTPTSVIETEASGGLCITKSYVWEISPQGGAWVEIGYGQGYPFNNQNITRGSFRLRRKVICGAEEAFSNILNYEINYQPQNSEQRNYIRVHMVTKPGVKDIIEADQIAIGNKFVSTEYRDGLGRVIQEVNTGAVIINGAKGDLVNHFEYDATGRTTKNFLPYATLGYLGKFKENAAQEQQSFNTTKFGEPVGTPTWNTTIYEPTPLNRVSGAKEPGAAWGDDPTYKGNRFENLVNRFDEGVRIWNIGINPGDLPTSDGVYETGKLFKIIHKDNDDKQTIEYIDFSGRVILKKAQEKEPGQGLNNQHDGWVCTYYIYDDLGRQRFIVTPKAVDILKNAGWNLSASLDIVRELCFYSDFDSKGRIVVAHRPGTGSSTTKGEEYTIYDKRDRIVFSQDENQRKRKITRGKAQWSFALYDELDRDLLSGLVDLDMGRADLQNAVDLLGNGNINISIFTGVQETATVHNPVVGNSTVCANCSNTVVNSITYYDDYTYSGVKSFDGNFSFPQPQAETYPVPAVVSGRVQGLATGGKVRVLNDVYDDNNPQNDKFLGNTIYYDEDGQPFEILEDNIKGGVNVTINQYDNSGLVLNRVEKKNVPGTAYTNFTTNTRYEYDFSGNVTAGYVKYAGNPEKQLTAYEYDELGELKTKTLAPGYTGNGGAYLEKLEYSYNINGKLTGINKGYATAPNYRTTQWEHFFGLYMGYDNRDGLFAGKRLNGQATGAIWRTQGDNITRKYNYQYDNLYRLTGASFSQREKAGDNWTNAKYNFSVNNLTYDVNGNLNTLVQMGATPGQTGATVIDNLAYTYYNNSNRLAKVVDNSGLGNKNGKLGDFGDGANGTNDDYAYDDNGNLVTDKNKGIITGNGNGVEWNFLDKPQKVIISNKSTIEFIYDATGEKIGKKVTPVSGQTVTTWYMDAMVFEEKNSVAELQFISNEAGRLRLVQPRTMQNPPSYYDLEVSGGIAMPDGKIGVFDYFIADHLGSTRMVLTEEIHNERHSCSMEEADAVRKAYEETNFGRVQPNGQPVANNEVSGTRSSHPGWTSNTSQKSTKLGGPGSLNKIGPNLLLKVMAGDQLNLSVKYYYNGATSNNPGSGLAPTIGGLINNLLTSGSNTGGAVKEFGGNIEGQLGATGGALNTFLNSQNPFQTTVPNAWLNWLFFDENFNFIQPDGLSGMRVEAPPNPANPVVDRAMYIPNLKIPANGYVLVYVSNESATTPVFFDDLDVTHIRGRITEENHYYAFGQKIHGIGGKSFGKQDNKYKYQGAYAEEETETGWNEFELRMYDPQIGRWLGIDPYDGFASPYCGMDNDPVNLFDEDGGKADIVKIGRKIIDDKKITTQEEATEKYGSDAEYIESLSGRQRFNLFVGYYKKYVQKYSDEPAGERIGYTKQGLLDLKHYTYYDEVNKTLPDKTAQAFWEPMVDNYPLKKERSGLRMIVNYVPVLSGFVNAGEQFAKGNFFNGLLYLADGVTDLTGVAYAYKQGGKAVLKYLGNELLNNYATKKTGISPKSFTKPKAAGLSNAQNVSKKTGAYHIKFASGKTYTGKGSSTRMRRSIRRLEKEHKDKAVSSRHIKTSTDKEAFKLEHRWMMKNDKPLSDPGSRRNTYNKIYSPGRNM